MIDMEFVPYTEEKLKSKIQIKTTIANLKYYN